MHNKVKLLSDSFVLHCQGNNEKGNVYACSVQMQGFFFSWTSWCRVSCSCGYVTHRWRVTVVYVWVPAAPLCTKYVRAQDLRTVTFPSYSSVQFCLFISPCVCVTITLKIYPIQDNQGIIICDHHACMSVLRTNSSCIPSVTSPSPCPFHT